MSSTPAVEAVAVVEAIGPRGCKGTSRRTGKPCGGIAVNRPDGRSTGYCRFHGGTMIARTRAGPSHPSWKHGRRSVYAKRLKHLGMGAAPSQDVLELGPELELMDVLVDRAAADLAEAVEVDDDSLWADKYAERLQGLAETRQRMTVAARKQITNEARRITNKELEAALKAVYQSLDRGIDDDAQRVSITRPIRELLGIKVPEDDMPVEEPLVFDTPP